MMEIVNVRIDDRLIHGQVATVWSQVTRAPVSWSWMMLW